MSGIVRTGLVSVIFLTGMLPWVCAQSIQPVLPAFRWADPFRGDTSWITQKNVALLSLLQDDEPLKRWLAADAGFKSLLLQMQSRRHPKSSCTDPDCYVAGFSVPDSISAAAAERLGAMWKPGNLLDRLLQNRLIPSGLYYQYRDSAAAVQLRLALRQDLGTLNYILAVYAGGRKPNYPLIDSISFDIHANHYLPGILYTAASVLAADSASETLFFQYPFRAAFLFLELNGRNDPANYEPMEKTVNREAVEYIKTILWKSYPYTLILVPGAGPGEGGTTMSAPGMLRCRLAREAWLQKKAPFIMVSGGKVHPYKTTFCEAEEMKKYLEKNLHVPASAILMEPHARHTTTNMRNAVRLIFRYGIPADRPALVVTDRLQAFGISTMKERCMKELKYMPYQLGNSLSETTLEFYPLPEALQINPNEPLDP